jgi:hypothetical protein
MTANLAAVLTCISHLPTPPPLHSELWLTRLRIAVLFGSVDSPILILNQAYAQML